MWKSLQRWWRQRRPLDLAAPLGAQGEALAAQHLADKGLRIVARGSRDRLGEIDLVALDGKTVVFVEVKTRRSGDAGHPADAVDARKQRKLTTLAVSYLKRNGLLGSAARFDVVAITWDGGSEAPQIDHLSGAFSASGRDSFFS
jgi:putative endonuclease